MARQSLSDKRMIEELNKGREHLVSQASSSRLLSALRRRLQSITRNIYVFDQIPEQCDEIYYLLVDGRIVVHIEIPRNTHVSETVF